MMPIRVNLISPFKKNRLYQLIRFLFLKELFEIAILTAASAAIIQIAGWYLLTEQLSLLAQSTVLISGNFSRESQKIVKINATIRALERASAGFEPTVPYIQSISDALPSEIKLSMMSINKTDRSVRLAGLAKTRAALVEYQEKLKNQSWVKNLAAPASQLLEKENIPFTFTLTLAPFSLKRVNK